MTSGPSRDNNVSSQAQLQASVRDLVSLLALPTVWSALNHDAEKILRTACEALAGILDIDVCYCSAILSKSDPAIRSLSVRGRDAIQDAAWFQLMESTTQQSAHLTCEVSSPIGRMHLMCVPFVQDELQCLLCVGTLREDFPTVRDALCLRVAVNLMWSGLQTARFVRESQRASRAKDEFLAMLGHELRNPLAPIATALQLMRLKGSDAFHRERQIIERQVGHLSALVDDLLDISRVTRGKIELTFQAMELKALVTKALETVSPLLEQKRHHLDIQVPDTGLLVRCDALRMTQVISNVLNNAAKFTPSGGSISISASTDAGQVALRIKDDGIGIAPEMLTRIFELFEQGHTTTSDRSAGGLGIGLSLARTLTELHGGSISARSEGIGKGSKFTITLPIAADQEHSEQSSTTWQRLSATSSHRVLVVDDNKDAAQLVADALRRMGYDVQVAFDPVSAMQIAREFVPTVAILDLGLPVLDGFELSRRLTEICPALTRLIALTGYGREADRQRTCEYGFVAHLTKPVQLEELREAIESSSCSER